MPAEDETAALRAARAALLRAEADAAEVLELRARLDELLAERDELAGDRVAEREALGMERDEALARLARREEQLAGAEADLRRLEGELAAAREGGGGAAGLRRRRG